MGTDLLRLDLIEDGRIPQSLVRRSATHLHFDAPAAGRSLDLIIQQRGHPSALRCVDLALAPSRSPSLAPRGAATTASRAEGCRRTSTASPSSPSTTTRRRPNVQSELATALSTGGREPARPAPRLRGARRCRGARPDHPLRRRHSRRLFVAAQQHDRAARSAHHRRRRDPRPGQRTRHLVAEGARRHRHVLGAR